MEWNSRPVSTSSSFLSIFSLLSVEGNQPGPSSRMVRRPKKMGSKQIAEIYARLSTMEGNAGAMEQASAIRFQELQQDIERLQSNGETQKKVMAQELSRIEEQTHSAEQRTQSQIDNLCQQTTDMHSSLTAIHQHSETLTDSLKTMMQQFHELRFDLPNAFDTWMKVREGRQNGPGTVTAAELQHQSWHPSHSPHPLSPSLQAPPPPPAPSLSNSVAPDTNTGSTESPHRTPPSSPNDCYQPYVPEQSDAILDLNDNLANSGGGDMDVDGEGLDLGDAVGIAQDGGEVARGGMGRMSDLGHEMEVEQEQGGEMESMALAERSTTPGWVEPEDTPLWMERENTPVVTEREVTPVLGAEAATPGGSGLGSGHEATSLIGEPGAMIDDDNLPQEVTSDVPPVVNPEPTQPLTPGPSQQTPPSTPPGFIRDHSFPPPAGLLVSNSIDIVPPSSQSSVPSPSPQPNYRLLNAPHTGTADVLMGPMTRSRSRSRSPIAPDVPTAEPVGRLPPIRRKTSRKPASKR
jgi:hypothetical protein